MSEIEDALDRLLREDAKAPVADGGFTRRVMEALPAPRGRGSRTWLILGATALGSAAAVTLAPLGPMVVQGFADLARHALTPSATAAIAMMAVLFVSGLVLAAEID